MEALGVGSAVRKLTVQNLRDALVTATTDPKQVERAKNVGEQIRSVSAFCICRPLLVFDLDAQEDGVETAIEAIYRDLEYARSLIKGSPRRESRELVHPENATIRRPPNQTPPSPARRSGESSASSAQGGAVSDWDVISDQDD